MPMSPFERAAAPSAQSLPPAQPLPRPRRGSNEPGRPPLAGQSPGCVFGPKLMLQMFPATLPQLCHTHPELTAYAKVLIPWSWTAGKAAAGSRSVSSVGCETRCSSCLCPVRSAQAQSDSRCRLRCPRRPAVAPIVPGLPASYAREPASRFSSSSNTTLPRVSTSLTVNVKFLFFILS